MTSSQRAQILATNAEPRATRTEAMEIFQGYDTFTSATKNSLVKGRASPPHDAIRNVVSSVSTSLKELHESLEIDASLSISYAAFSADAKAKYVHSLDLTTYAVVVVVRAANRSTVDRIDAAVPGEAKATLDTDKGVFDFVRQYGDSFISSVTTGSEYFATFTFYSQNLKEQTDVEASLGGKGAYAGVSVDTSVSTKISNALKTTNVRYAINQFCTGLGSVALPYDPDQDKMIQSMVKFAMDFSHLDVSVPETVSFVTTPFEELLPEAHFDQVTKNRRAFVGADPELGWGGMVARLTQLKNDCEALRRTYAYYGGYEDSVLDTNYNQVIRDLNMLNTLVATVDQQPTTDPVFTPPASLKLGSPSLSCVVLPGSMLDLPTNKNPSHPNQTYVGGGGGEFAYHDVTADMIGQRVRLHTLKAFHGDWVDRLIVSYVAPSAVSYVAPSAVANAPQKEITLTHGGGSGHASDTLTLADDEFITKMGGWTGCWIGHCDASSLSFVTSKGQTMFTYTDQDANYKEWNAQPGDVFVGFIGRSGDGLDSTQPLVMRFSPATWVAA